MMKSDNSKKDKSKSKKDKYYSKKDKSMDFEMEHLKEHLNSSFDFNKITMSEDLFDKTLKAINAGETPKVGASDGNDLNETNNITGDAKKKNKFPIYKFAGVAAAVVILVIGLNKIQDNLIMGKKDYATTKSAMDLDTEKSLEDRDTVEDSKSNTATIAETAGSTDAQASETIENKETNLDISDNIKINENRVTIDGSQDAVTESKVAKDAVNEDTGAEDQETFNASSESQATVDTTSDSDAVMDNPITYSINSSISQKASDSKLFAKQDSTNYPIIVTDYIIFDDIYQITFYDQYTKDNIEGTNEKKTTINPEIIKEFYQLLNECTFTESDKISGDLYYKIVILLKNKEQSYTLNIKDGIQLLYQDKLHPENDYQLNFEGSTDKLKNWLIKYLA